MVSLPMDPARPHGDHSWPRKNAAGEAIRQEIHVLVRRSPKSAREHFQIDSLPDRDKDEDIRRMYALLARARDGRWVLRNKFEERTKKAALSTKNSPSSLWGHR